MELMGYKEWSQIFNEDLSTIWQSEKKELQTVTVLFVALQLELKNLQTKIDDQLSNLRKKIEEKEELEQKLSPISLNVQQNPEELKTSFKDKSVLSKTCHKVQDIQSPDLFKVNECLADDSLAVIDLSVSDDDDDDDVTHIGSPTLNKSKKPYRRLKEKSQEKSIHKNDVKRDIFQHTDEDETFIENIPANHIEKRAQDSKSEALPKNALKREQSSPNKTDELFFKKQKTSDTSVVEPEPVIRGKARKTLMKGTSCKDCQKFYGSMNLPPDELQKLLNKCSNHRYVYRPHEETMPGFWDLTFPDE